MCGEKVFDLIFCQFLEATVLTNCRHLHLRKLAQRLISKKNFSHALIDYVYCKVLR